MIQGIKIQISSKELKTHLNDKVKLHKEKEAFYNAQVKNLEKGVEQNVVDESLYNNASNNPVSTLQQSAKKHKQRAEFFQFIADHLVNEDYELTESDLTKLEIISGMYF